MLYLNQHGNEVLLNPYTIEQIKLRGEWHLFSKGVMKHEGTGPKNKILLLLNTNGIGDDIHAMPAVAQKLSEGFQITVVGREFTRECFRGCEFIPEELTGPGFVKSEIGNYGAIYSLKMWCINHDEETQGYVFKDRFEQFAELIKTAVPEKFSWIEHFALGTRKPKGHVLFAPDSTSPYRTYDFPDELIEALKAKGIEVKEAGTGRAQKRYSSFQQMLRAIYNSKLVIAADNGILNIALALGIPTVGIFGPTNEKFIAEPFSRFHPIKFKAVRGIPNSGCDAPCSLMGGRGFGLGDRCDTKAQCLTSLTPESITDAVLSLI